MLAGLAGYRAAQALGADAITAPARAAVFAWAWDDQGQARGPVRGKLGDLVDCVECMGFWLAAGAALAYRHPRARPVVDALAAAGATLLVQRALDAATASATVLMQRSVTDAFAPPPPRSPFDGR